MGDNILRNHLCAMRRVAVFDFDGTLTTKDTLLEFIKFTHGKLAFFLGFTIFAPILILMKLHLFPNWRAKQMVFSWFYKGMEYAKFAEYGECFADNVEEIRKESTILKLKALQSNGADIYVISASIDDWVRPFCIRLGVKTVLGTKVEVKNGKLTGRFLTKNCYGQEKVNRLLEAEPNRNGYYLYAFGDSRGDKEMLEFAEEGIKVY